MEPIKYENRLKQCRLDVGLKQRQVVELLGLHSANRLSRWEAGLAEPNLKNLLQLSRIYDVDVEMLFPLDDGLLKKTEQIKICRCQLKYGEACHVYVDRRIFRRRDGTLETATPGNSK